MSDSLGLSIGMTNLVAARIGRPPVMRRSVLTLFNDRAPEVGVPGENPNLNQPGLVLSGFVERVGDPVPLVAADGSPHLGERVLVEALDAMARTVGGGAPIAIAVPAHWGPATRRCAAGCAAREAEPRAERCARGAHPGFGRGARGAAGRTRAAVERRRRAGGPGRQRNQHHAGRRRFELRPDRRDGPVFRLLRRPDRPGTAQPCGRRNRRSQQRRSHRHAGARIAGPAARRGPAGQGTAVRRDGDGGARRAARLQLRHQGHPQRAREPHLRAARRSAEHHRRNVAAQQHSRLQCVRRRDRRRRGQHSAGHPAAVGAAARPRRHHAAVPAQRRGGRRAGGRPRTGGGRAHRDGADRAGARRGRADGHGRRGLGRGRRGFGRLRVGL